MAVRLWGKGLCGLLFPANRSLCRINPSRKFLSPLANNSRQKSTIKPAILTVNMTSEAKPIQTRAGSSEELVPSDGEEVRKPLLGCGVTQEETSPFSVDMPVQLRAECANNAQDIPSNSASMATGGRQMPSLVVREEDEITLTNQADRAVGERGSSEAFDKGSEEGVAQDGSGCKEGGDDKYLYLQRGFTSEIFKIEIQNIPKYIGYTELKKKLEKLGLKPVKIKKPQRFQHLPHCFVTFRSEEDREIALKALEGQVWKNKPITAKVAAPSVDPLYRQRERRKREAGDLSRDEGATKNKKLRLLNEEGTHLTLDQRLDKVVTPLLGTSYESQLATKTAQMRLALQKAAYLIQKEDSYPGPDFARQVKQHGGMMCELKPTLSSPLQTGYRNKAEVSVGTSLDGTPVVGFRLGSYEEGNFTVASPENCVHIPDKIKDLCKTFQEFFKRSSLPPYTSPTESGYWRQVALRCYTTGESMAVVMIHPQSLTEDELTAEKQKLLDFFTDGPGASNAPTSLYFHTFARKTKEQTLHLEHLLGEKHVHETILGLQFRISPDAFFQTNSPATEILYRQVHDFCCHGNRSDPSLLISSTSELPPPTVYDICCGTGTIGLYLAKALPARRVIGVEMTQQAVEDARANAELNAIGNAQFVCGRAEDVLQRQLEEECWAESGEVIGIVDPPRAGLHSRVIQCIRKQPQITRLVYVACNPEGHTTIGNFVDLCRRPSLRVKGTPFSPVMAVPVDLFPHTPHCELVILFERSTPNQPTSP